MSKKDKHLYDENSIESLTPLEFTRLKAGVYAGDTTYATQLLVEIISNAIDEYHLGHGNKVEVEIDGATVTVADHGQGFIPNSFREDGKTILEAAYSVLNTSGKYREDGTYEGTSLGSFGIGSKITTFLSHWLRVRTWRDGIMEAISFKEGVFEDRVIREVANKKDSGTLVTWQASEEFFTNPIVEIEKVKSLFRTIVCLCPGLTIELTENLTNGKNRNETFYSKNGINDLVDDAVKGTELISNRMIMNYADGKNQIDLVLTYANNYSLTVVPYVNTGLTESGQHITQVKTAVTREFNKFFRAKGWLKGDEKLTGDDIQEGMYIVFNITAPNVAYDSQIKSKITKIDMTPFTAALANSLEAWLNVNEKEIKAIFDKATTAKKARDAQKRVREKIRSKAAPKNPKVKKFDSKLADCNSHNRNECSIIVTEGDSASGNLKMIRDRKTIAVMPVRGKILNVEKATLEEIMDNQEIMTMMEAFGLVWDPTTLKAKISPQGLRYGKIVIMADGDVDGAHIRILFFTFLWRVCRELFDLGVVYAALPPLYKIIKGNDKFEYLADDAALEEYRNNHQNQRYEVYRFKGLGEMSQEETKILLDPNIRRWEQVVAEDVEACDKLIQDLMGKDVQPRREYLIQHADAANIDV